MSGRGRLIIVSGLPGAGKTTHAKRLVTELGAIRFSPDEWMDALSIDLYDEEARARIEALQAELTWTLLQFGQTVVIEWGTWSRAERDTLREMARKLEAWVELHYLDESNDVLWQRLTSRGAEWPPFQKSDLEASAKAFEVPSAEEMSLYDPPS